MRIAHFVSVNLFILAISAAAFAAESQATTADAADAPEQDTTSQEPEKKENDGRGLFLHSIDVTAGYSHSVQDTSNANGGIQDAPELALHGWAARLGLYVAPAKLPALKLTSEFTRRNHEDRSFTQIALGVKYNFEFNSDFSLFLGISALYTFLHWNEPPAADVASGVGGAESFGVGAMAGLDWFFSKYVGLTIGVKADYYGLETTAVQGGASTSINDFLGITVLGGLAFRFNKPKGKTACPPQEVPETVCECNCACDAGTGTAQAESAGDADMDGVADAFDECQGTLIGVPVDETGCPLAHIEFDLEFEYAEFTLPNMTNRPEFAVVAFMNKHPEYSIEITGHTDYVGSKYYNKKLSELRAWEAADYLISHGIDEERVEYVGKGKKEPKVRSRDKRARKANRRVHVKLTRQGEETRSVEPITEDAAPDEKEDAPEPSGAETTPSPEEPVADQPALEENAQ